MLLERELQRLAHAFRHRGVELLVLKGVPLTRRLYGAVDARFSIDNDLLVRRKDVTEAHDVLRRLGYASSPGRELKSDLSSTFQHPMRHVAAANALLRCELHWHAFPPHLFDVPEQDLWQHSIEFRVFDAPVRVFDEYMTVLHLASHHVQHRCSELKVLRDIGRAWHKWQNVLDLDALAKLAAAYGMEAALSYSLQAARAAGLCESQWPRASRRAKFVEHLVPPARLGHPPTYASIFGSLLLASPRCLPAAFAHELLPPIPILSRIYGVPESPWLIARYPARWIRPLRTLLGVASRSRS